MNRELIQNLEELQAKIKKTWQLLDLDATKTRMKILEVQMNEADFWNNQEQAKEVSKEYEDLKNELEIWEQIEKENQDLIELAKLGEDVGKDYEQQVRKFEKLEFYILLDGKYDQHNALIAIHAGAGGVDAQDWAEMLQRMLLRYAERKDFRVKLLEMSKVGKLELKRQFLKYRVVMHMDI